MSDLPRLTFSGSPGDAAATLEGAWTAPHANELEKLVEQAMREAGKGGKLTFDLARIGEIDTYGAWLVERTRRALSGAGRDVRVRGISARNRPLMDEVAETPEGHEPHKVYTRQTGDPGFAEEAASRGLKERMSYLVLAGATIAALGRAIVNPARYRWTSTVYQFDRVGWKALPIVLLVTFIIGAIIAQQGFFHFRRFGADLYVVDMIGFLVMREIGLLLVAIVIAGRSGSSYTAELGSMKMREEIDALRTMGFDPVEVLVLPRVLVLVVALPVLTFIGSVAALAGAGVVAIGYAGLSPDLFMDRLREAITMDHFLVGLIKAPFIGFVIGIISCVEGFRVRGSTTSLGSHTTQSVVKSIFMVIVLDGIFALLFSAIGM